MFSSRSGPKNFLHSLLRWTSVLLFVCSLVSVARADQSTGNQYVTATIQDGNGLVNWYAYGNTKPNPHMISRTQFSYLTVLLNGLYYSNNPYVGVTGLQDLNTGGVLGKSGDTASCTWSISSIGVDIIEEIYPVQFSASGQVVLQVRFVNHKNSAAQAQVQYLLDIDVNGVDDATILTRWGYSPNWVQFPNFNQPIPPWFISFEKPLPPAPPKYATGYEGFGYFDNPDLGLIKPLNVVIGDWSNMSSYLWGPGPFTAGQPYGDNAILMQWDAVNIPGAGQGTSIGAKTSYGTGEFHECNGNIYALTFSPHELKYNPATSTYFNNPFTIESLIFNTSSTNTASSVTATLTVSPPLKIISPNPIVNGGTQQTHSPASNAINPLDVADLQWQVQAPLLTNCSHDDTAYFNLDIHAIGGFIPPFIRSCDMPVIIDCTSLDIVAPVVDNVRGGANFQDSLFNVHDSSQLDRGIKDIIWTYSGAFNAANAPVGVVPPLPIVGCPKNVYQIGVRQTDSTKAGCVTFTFTDCSNNTSTKTFCFQAHPRAVKNSVDSIPPKFLVISPNPYNCTSLCDSVLVTDNGVSDTGIQSIAVKVGSATNMSLILSSAVIPGDKEHGFRVCAIDPILAGKITIVAADRAGNVSEASYQYCNQPDTSNPRIVISGTRSTYHLHVTDSIQPLDRGIDSVIVYNGKNIRATPDPINLALTRGKPVFDFDIQVIDTFASASFCVRANDLAGHASIPSEVCAVYNNVPDIWAPNISVVPLAANPKRATVRIDDNHLDDSGMKEIGWDTGIDSVWFTNYKNISLFDPATGLTYTANIPSIKNPRKAGFPPFPKVVPPFDIFVTDSTSLDPMSCITIWARDGGGNVTDTEWCYFFNSDTSAPRITGTGATKTSLTLHLSDAKPKDQGLEHAGLQSSLNFQPFAKDYNGAASDDVTLSVSAPGKSATGTLTALDHWGAIVGSLSIKAKHTTSIDFAIHVQNLHANRFFVLDSSSTFDIPIYLDTADFVSIPQKHLTSYRFTVQLAGDPGIALVAPITARTESQGWAVTSVIGPGRTTVAAQAPLGQYLADSSLPLIILRMHGDTGQFVRSSTLILLDSAGAGVYYNGGHDSTIVATNATAIVSPPYGNLNAINIIVNGRCSPVVATGTKPSIVSLSPNHPNPVANETRIDYTMPAEGEVSLKLFDALGSTIETIAEGVRQQGEYEAVLDTRTLPAGIYFVRLEALGKILTRKMNVTK